MFVRTREKWCVVGLTLLLGKAAFAQDDDDEFDFLAPNSEQDSLARPEDAVPDSKSFLDDDDDEEEWEIEGTDGDFSATGTEAEGEDPPDDDPEDQFSEEPDEDLMVSPAAASRGLGLTVEGKTPLTGGFPLKVVSTDLDAVVVELPVLVGRQRADFDGEDFWLLAELWVDGRRVSEQRVMVGGSNFADLGPSLVWFKAFLPVSSSQGTVEVKVQRQPVAGGDPQPLFSESTSYRL